MGNCTNKCTPLVYDQLPTKEQNVFKRMQKCYEQKQFKQGLKLAKQILSNAKCSEHADTLAAKGLLLLGLGKYADAEESIRRGLKNDLRSFTCWHGLAQLLKEQKKYHESIKCLRNCLRLEPGNLDILRNLSVLSIHVRDLEGYRDVRQQLFQQKPTQRASWGGLALSYHLLGDYELSLKILDEYKKSQNQVNREVVGEIMKSMFNKKSEYDLEHSEIIKYHIKVLEEAGHRQEALQLLQDNKSKNLDKDFMLNTESDLLMNLGRFTEAVGVLETILKRNPHRANIVHQLIDCKQLKSDLELMEWWSTMSLKHPSSDTLCVVVMQYVDNPHFSVLCEKYLKEKFVKRCPSALINIKQLYASHHKGAFIGHVLDKIQCEVCTKETEDSNLLAYYRAQHSFYLRSYKQGLDEIDECIQNSPDMPEYYLLKAKLLKHVEDDDEAVKWMEQAFKLDPTDRCIGSKLAKYQLQIGQVDAAISTMGKFTKPGQPALSYLVEIQCTWFILRLAKVYFKQDKLGECLLYCHKLLGMFQAMEEDLFDFHHYSLTKLRLSAYISLIRQQDKIRGGKEFIEMCIVAVRCYIKLHDRKAALTTDSSDNTHTSKKTGKGKNSMASAQEEEATQYEYCENPLEEAKVFLEHLQAAGRERPETFELSADIQLRRGKPLLVLQALNQLNQMKLCKENGLHTQSAAEQITLQLRRFIGSNTLDKRVMQVIANSAVVMIEE